MLADFHCVFPVLLLLLGHILQVLASDVVDESNILVRIEAGNRNESLFLTPPKALPSKFNAAARSLAVHAISNWEWPPDTLVKFQYDLIVLGEVQGFVDSATTSSSNETIVIASGCRNVADGGPPVEYNRIQIESDGTSYGPGHAQARVKLVTVDNRWECANDNHRVPMGIVDRTSGAKSDLGLSNDLLSMVQKYTGVVDDILKAESKIVFMWGGYYYLCYTPDGGFDEATAFKENMAPVKIKVLGVRSPCSSGPSSTPLADGCIESERWECFFSYEGDGSVQNCILSFLDGNQGRPGWSVTTADRSKVSWSKLWAEDRPLNLQGQLLSAESKHPKYCSVEAEPPDTGAVFDQAASGELLVADGSTEAKLPLVLSTHNEAFTVAACYCPSYNIESGKACVNSGKPDDCCDNSREFIQMVGVIHFWTIRICNADSYTTCTSPYRRVLPHQRFVLRVQCPTGGACEAEGKNLVKLVERVADSDLPSWNANHPCHVSPESASVVWPTVASSQTLSGGIRQDYKAWVSQQLKINKSLKKEVDVCYSNSNSPPYFFKVGTIKTADTFAFASEHSSHDRTTLKYVNYLGSLTLFGGIVGAARSPYDANMFSGKALAYLLSFDREKIWGYGKEQMTLEKFLGSDRVWSKNLQTKFDNACKAFKPSTFLVEQNPLPIGQIPDGAVDRYITFSGKTKHEYIKVKMAGVVAVCYCGMVTDLGACSDASDWVFAGKLTVHGPWGTKQWEFDIEVVVKLEVYGWGLSSNDKLRVIQDPGSCADNDGDPDSDTTTFKIQCPGHDAIKECVFPANKAAIPASARTGHSLQNHIISIKVNEDSTHLEFEKPIRDTLFEDDVITIDIASVLIENKTDDEETNQDRYDRYLLSGEYDFQNTLEGGSIKKYMVGHRVSYIKTPTGVEESKLSIPLGWPEGNQPNFTVYAGGKWTRRNQIETKEEIKGMVAKSGLKVCWGAQPPKGNGKIIYYKQAGALSFVTPPTMKTVGVYLSTKQAKAIAPGIIQFETGSDRNEYATVGGKTKLTLRFLDVRVEKGILHPYFAQDLPYTCTNFQGCPDELPKDDTSTSSREVTYEDAKQVICGKLFIEMWSEDSEGFPVPHGCYYSRELVDGLVPGVGEAGPSFREVTIVFAAKNGLRAKTKYMLTMHLKNPVANSDKPNAVDIVSMCAEEFGCSRPYKVFEKLTARLKTETLEKGSDGNNPRINIIQGGAILVSDNDAGVSLLSWDPYYSDYPPDDFPLQLKLVGGPGQTAIKSKAIVRMSLWPLTMWSLGAGSCEAECIPFDESTAARCEGETKCHTEAVMESGGRQVLRVQLPEEMTDITDVTTHTIKFTNLNYPTGGFFPTRAGVQLTQEDDSDPQYITTSGMIWKWAEDGETNGMVVLSGTTGNGPNPFTGDANRLVVRIQFGATLWNWGDKALACSIEIRLPLGYTCNVADSGEPPMTHDVFKVDSDEDGYFDNRRGLLAVNDVDGNWARSAKRACVYELKAYNRMYYKQVVYVELDVVNDGIPLRKDNRGNVWDIQLSSKGAWTTSETARSFQYVKFTNNSMINLMEDGPTFFSSNAAVIKELVGPLFQPGTEFPSMTGSCCGGNYNVRRITQFMRVFFRPGVTVGQRGYVVIDAPRKWDFQKNCIVQDLDPGYYAYAGETEWQVKKLKPPVTCVGQPFPPLTAQTNNRARIRVSGLIDVIDLAVFGFQIEVLNPGTWVPDMSNDWRIFLEDAQRFSLEGSRDPVRFNPIANMSSVSFKDTAFGLYDGYMRFVRIVIQDLQPISIANQPLTKITIHPFVFPQVLIATSLRITAPFGFNWSESSDHYKRSVNCGVALSDDPCIDFGGIDSPAPYRGMENELIFSTLSFDKEVKYGFQYQTSIPKFNPRTSANAFFFEFGFDNENIEDRPLAFPIEAPKVAALTNCKVSYNTNQLKAIDNRIQFKFDVVTPVTLGSGIVIVGNTNCRGFVFEKQMYVLEGSDKLPRDISLEVIVEPDGTPRIMLIPTTYPLMPGFYYIEIPALNPGGKILIPGTWTFGSYKEVYQYPTKYYLDNEMNTPGFEIHERMNYAGFWGLNDKQKRDTFREDRPGYLNRLLFVFEVRKRPQIEQVMILKAPHGFVFPDDCMGSSANPKLITDFNEVFGENTGGLWPSNKLTMWQYITRPISCSGDGRDAHISIPVGLEMKRRYAFRIEVTNPRASPEWNKWTINYNQEASDAFPGFNIWTALGNPAAVPVSRVRSQVGAPVTNPVTFNFEPYKSIPSPQAEDRGGVLQIKAPSNFKFDHDDQNKCQVDLRIFGSPLPYANSQIDCETSGDHSSMYIFFVGSSPLLGAEHTQGTKYNLTANILNPSKPQLSGPWKMNSYSRSTREPTYSLDETIIPGYDVIQDLWKFTVKNTAEVINGLQPVPEVQLTLSFRDHIKDDDELIIYAPKGFNIVSNPEEKVCYAYRAKNQPFPKTGKPKCQCMNSDDPENIKCFLWWKRIKESKDPALVQKQEISFKISTDNPAKTPFITDNYWLARHTSGDDTLGVMAEQVAKSWDIKPQLREVKIEFAAGYRSAQSLTSLDFTILPVNNARVIDIEARYPAGFDFSLARVDPLYIIAEISGPRIKIGTVVGLFLADQSKTVRVYDVKLGRGGGQTRFNIKTWATPDMNFKMDESWRFEGGFRLPGNVVIHSMEMKSGYTRFRLFNPVKSEFPPRIGEWAALEFRISVTQPVMAQARFLISSQGVGKFEPYTLRPDNFLMTAVGGDNPGSISTITGMDDTGALMITLLPGQPAGNFALRPDMEYFVTFEAYPIDRGIQAWRFDFVDSFPGFTNTNDGISDAFLPVGVITFEIAAARTPPKSLVDIMLDVDIGKTLLRECTLIAPGGFIFDDDPADGCGDLCRAGQRFGSDNRNTARFALESKGPIDPQKMKNLRIRAVTPSQNPKGTNNDALLWFIECRENGPGTTQGWGEGQGFGISQITGGAVYYAGIAKVKQTQICFTFTIAVDAGKFIKIKSPEGVLLTCSAPGTMKKMSLPGLTPTCVDDPMELTLTESLEAGSYAFCMIGDIPPVAPNKNSFDIIIIDEFKTVVDAAYDIVGSPIIAISAALPTLYWTDSKPGLPSKIVIGITFTKAVDTLQALLITFPDLFIHRIARAIDVVNFNPNFPLAPGLNWVESKSQEKLKIWLDDSKMVNVIPAGTYQFSFPVLIPPNVPRQNIWYISLCHHRDCQGPKDSQVSVTFPIAGFDINEEANPIFMGKQTNSAKRIRHFAPQIVLEILLLIALFVEVF